MRKFVLVLAVVILYAAAAEAQPLPRRVSYIDKYKDLAIEHMKLYGIPASITLAQGCLESGDGTSSLAVRANNHFGIKCHTDWSGKRYHQDDDKRNECFRHYKTVEESYIDHSLFLSTRPRYKALFSLSKENYKAWAYGLKAAGYATNPKYAQLLIQIIEEYDLSKYDKETGNEDREAEKRSQRMEEQGEELREMFAELDGLSEKHVAEQDAIALLEEELENPQHDRSEYDINKEVKEHIKTIKRLERQITKLQKRINKILDE